MVDLKLAMENAHRSLLESKMNRALSQMTPAQQQLFLQRVAKETPELQVERPIVQEVVEEPSTSIFQMD